MKPPTIICGIVTDRFTLSTRGAHLSARYLDKTFPPNIECVYYGSDIGQTNSPSTIVKLGGSNDNIYLEMKGHAAMLR